MQKIIVVLSIIILLITSVAIAESGMGVSGSGFLTSQPPDAPILYRPANEAADLPDTINVIWRSQIHAASYHLQISTAFDFSNLSIDQADLTDTLFSTSTLAKNTTYYWRISASNVAGEGDFSAVWSFATSFPVAVDGKIRSLPKDYALLPVYPNPFNPATTITYHLPEEADISLMIYNSMGQHVRELGSGQQQSGEHTKTWDGLNNRGAPVTSGLYICYFKADSHVFTQKILLMR
jgi:hypothetical protein